MLISRRNMYLAAAIAASLQSVLARADTESTYTGPTNGLWNTAANWTNVPPGAFVPNNGNGGANYAVTIGAPVNPNVIVQANTSSVITINTLTILGTGSGMTLLNNATFTINSGTVNNQGVISIAATSSATDLRITGDVLLTGAGSLTMGNTSNNRIFGTIGSAKLTVDTSQTIIGGGQLGVGSMGLINNGTVNATAATGMIIQPSTAGAVNNALLLATASTLTLRGSTFTNNGVIQANDASLVRMDTSVIINGGSLTTVGSGQIRTNVSQVATLANVTITAGSNVGQENNSSVNMSGTITNNGTYSILPTSSATDLRISGNTTFGGSGIFVMGNNTNSRIFAINSIDTLTVNSTTTVQGSGQFGVAAMAVANQGIISANDPLNALTIQANATGLTNTGGVLLATNGGNLFLSGSTFNNAGGNITAGGQGLNGTNVQASLVHLTSSVAITGGNLNSTGIGRFQIDASNVASLSNVTFTAGTQLLALNNSNTILSNTITNNGTFTLSATSSVTDIHISGPTLFNGNGVFNLTNDADNRISAINGLDTLTVGAGITIQGAGNLGGGALSLINNGTISSNLAAGMILQPNSNATAPGFTNNNLMASSSGSTMTLHGGVFHNENGIIQANDTSFVRLDTGVTILGGSLTTTGTGKIISSASQAATLNNITLTTGSNFATENNATVFLTGTITNNGVFTHAATSSATDIKIVGPTRFSGNGTFSFTNSANNRLLANNNIDTLTIDPGITIQGAGQVGAGALAIINNGTIIANQPAGMIVSPNATGFTNNLLLLATAGSTMSLHGGVFTNNNATIRADDASLVRLDTGITILGGSLTTTGTGKIINSTSQAATLNNITLTTGSNFLTENNSTTLVSGTLTNNGVFTHAATSSATDIKIVGPTRFTGNGTFTMTSPNSRLLANNNIDTLTIDPGITIQGAGQVGAGALAIVNSGTIIANNSSSALIVAPNATGFISTGTLLANGGTLTFSGNTHTLSGNITATNGGTLAFNSGAITVTSPVNVNGGTAAFNGNNNSVTTITGTGTSSVGTSGSVISDRVTVDSLSVATGGLHTIRQVASLSPTPSIVTNLTFTGTGRLDLTNNSLIVKNGATVGSQIRTAAHLGAWNGSPGLTSTRAQAAATSSTATGLGYATGTEFTTNNGQTSFQGLTFNATDTLVMYTLAGDANMDKSVTFADFLLLQNNYNQQNTSWARGDWNYDGSTTFADFLILQNNYNKILQAANLLSDPLSTQNSGGGALRTSTVPEPASLILLALVAPLAAQRRRHRN